MNKFTTQIDVLLYLTVITFLHRFLLLLPTYVLLAISAAINIVLTFFEGYFQMSLHAWPERIADMLMT